MKKVEIIRPIALNDTGLTNRNPINRPVETDFASRIAKTLLFAGPAFALFLGIFILTCEFFPANGSEPDLMLCLIGTFIVVGSLMWLIGLIRKRKYKPGLSFLRWRLTKKMMLIMYVAIAVIAVVLLIYSMTLKFKLIAPVYLIGVVVGVYYLWKSFKVHEDVDYVANQELADILGMDIDEKVQASYFKDEIIFLLTDKKIIFAYKKFVYKKGDQWIVLNKKIDEIIKVGVLTSMMMGEFFKTELYLLLLFGDSTKLELKMMLTDNFTSNPDLFFKRFLVTLDNVLLGKTDEKIVARRRVTVNNDAKSEATVREKTTGVRKIDISDIILDNLRDATPMENTRTLEF